MQPSLDRVHRAATLFPMMEGAPFDELVADIAQHGQREPVYILPDGTLIDGRNRVRACGVLGRAANSVLYLDDMSDDAITRFVVSQNIHRRHLTEEQRAMIGVEVEKVFAEAARKRMVAGKAADPKANLPQGQARDEAAAVVGVSGRSIQTAKHITRHGTVELQDAVRAGKISLNKASGIAKKPKEQQGPLVHESVLEIPKLKEQRRQQIAAMTPAERKALQEQERHAAEIANARGRFVGFVRALEGLAAYQVDDVMAKRFMEELEYRDRFDSASAAAIKVMRALRTRLLGSGD